MTTLVSLLTSVFAFILAIGVLVTIHEFGHFWVARKLGVKVLRFSVGFGHPLWRYVAKDQTEYVLAAIPLGGYVKMLDEREGDVPPDQLDQAFNRQGVWKRIAIVAAGPLANFLLAILISMIVFLIGLPAERPYLAEPVQETPAALAGIQAGDKLLAINDQAVKSWSQARLTFLENYLANNQQIRLTIETEQGQREEKVLDVSQYTLLKEEGDHLAVVGLQALRPPATVRISQILPDSAAATSQLQVNDTVLAFDGQPVRNAYELINAIKAKPNESATLTIQRETDAGVQQLEQTLVIGAKQVNNETVGSLGAGISSSYSDEVREKFLFLDQQAPWEAFMNGVQKTWQLSVLTLKAMGKMLIGEASLKNISGPLTIADLAGKTLTADIIYYLNFLAIISVSLGVLNLLPIPMLDGGHLLYYSIELLTGKPVSEDVQALGFRIGLTLVAGMMLLALYNDITRLLY
ncbi:MAG: RIP metalloprotease RseP [bacterium]